MEDYFAKFTIITNKKEYQKKRLQLVDSMLACFCFDKNDINSNNSEILELLEGIKENFSHKIEVVLLEKSSMDEDFRKNIFADPNVASFFMICEPHNVDATPLSIQNFDQFELYKYFEEKAKFFEVEFPLLKSHIFDRIKKILDSHPIVIFIKGTPFKPFCKYSKQFMELIRPLKIRYRSFDIFTDDNLRTFLRLYSGWKTYPQIYINGKIIGGVDVLKGLIDSGEINKVIPDKCKFDYVLNETKKAIAEELVVFGRGKREFIEDQNTAETVKILDSYNLGYNYIDVMKDQMVGEIVLDINHQEFPQIYSFGHFLGSLTNLKDLVSNHNLYSIVPINCHKGFSPFADLFKENTIVTVLFNDLFELVELLYDIKDQNPNSDFITYKQTMKPDLVKFLQEDLKIKGKNYVVFKFNKIYKYE